jgi:hypothetical protein
MTMQPLDEQSKKSNQFLSERLVRQRMALRGTAVISPPMLR